MGKGTTRGMRVMWMREVNDKSSLCHVFVREVYTVDLVS